MRSAPSVIAVAMGLSLVLGAFSSGCLQPSEKLTEGQYNDLFHPDTKPVEEVEVGDGDVSETPDVADTADVADTREDSDTGADTSEDSAPDAEVIPEVIPDTEVDTEVTPDTEVDTEVTPETEVGPEIVEDCTVEPLNVNGACLSAKRELFVFEPEHGPDALPTSLVRAERVDGASSAARAAEPLEVALENGRLTDPTLLAYFPMESSRDNSVVGSEYDLALGPVLEDFTASQTGFGQAAIVAPRFFGPIAAPGTRAQTLMGWFNIAAQGVSKTYDLMGYEADNAPTSELALGIEGGQWTALMSGTKTTFGAVVAGWQHVALTWDPDSGVAVLYLDGAVTAVARPALNLLSTNFFVGAKFPMGSHDLGPQPLADEVLVFGRPLPSTEVRAYVQMRRTFGSKLMPEAQPDYDDLRVVRTGGVASEMVAREIIGRRPHSDRGAEVEGVFGVWPMNGNFNPSYFREGFSDTNISMGIVAEAGVFGDSGGALRGSTLGSSLIAVGRPAWGPELTIELWLKVGTGAATIGCTNATYDDGATLMASQGEDSSLDDGFALRLCNGKVELRTSAGFVLGATDIADDRWHHVMASYSATLHRVVVDGELDGSVATNGAPADALRPIILLHRPPGSSQPFITNAAIDDLVLHDSVLPVGYATNRVWPTLPHVRFLVDTGPPQGAGNEVSPVAPFELRAGNSAVVSPAINACGSLVSPCTGYVAWWRFENTAGGLLDASTNGLQLTSEGPLTWTRGFDGGLGLAFDGVAQSLIREHTGEPGLDEWHLEAAARPAGSAVEQTIIERPGIGAPPGEVSLNYGLRIDNLGVPGHDFRRLTENAAFARSSVATTAGVWAALGGSYDLDGNTLSVVIDETVTTVTPSGVPTPELIDAPLFIGRSGAMDDFRYYAGDLDALRIMDRPLLAAERQKYPVLSWQPR